MEFIEAEVLKHEFEVEGSFYNLEMCGKVFECRNYAQVFRKDRKIQDYYDAILVLVNPGLSTPKQSSYQIRQANAGEIPLYYTPAKTDNTQYQVMRLMRLKSWNNVLLLNLSDIRAGNLTEFKQKLHDANEVGFESHSIFSSSRVEELKQVTEKCNGPVILAWGTDTGVKNLAELALQVLPHEKIVGWEFNKQPYYYHASPLPKKGKIRWLENMKDRIS